MIENQEERMFQSDIKNVAVLVYGQYRVADTLIQYIKDFYSTEYNVNVDFFVSVKSGNSYQNNKQYREKHGDGKHIEELDVDNVTRKIRAFLNPIDMNVIYTEDDDNIVKGCNNARLFTGFIDAIRMKQLHETRHDFHYDMVFCQRLDVYVWPDYLLDATINWYNTVTVHEFVTAFTSTKKAFMFISYLNTTVFNYSFYSMAQDLLIWGSSLAFDLMMFESLKIPNNDTIDDTINNPLRPAYKPWNSLLCGHDSFADIIKRTGIQHSLTLPHYGRDPHSDVPRIFPKNLIHHHQPFTPHWAVHQVTFSVVRPEAAEVIKTEIVNLHDFSTYRRISGMWNDLE